jgi:hypothetical protein
MFQAAFNEMTTCSREGFVPFRGIGEAARETFRFSIFEMADAAATLAGAMPMREGLQPWSLPERVLLAKGPAGDVGILAEIV